MTLKYAKKTNTNIFFQSLIFNIMNHTFIFNQTESLLTIFSNAYTSVHGWLSLVICFIGLSFNLINIIVLKKNSSSEGNAKTNLILISIAISDSILMLTYIPYSIFTYIIKSKSDREKSDENSLWSMFSIFHMVISVTSHSISIWLTVYLAFFRYVFMSESVNSIKRELKIKKNEFNKIILVRCLETILIICAFCFFICLPVYAYPLFKYTTFISLKNNFLIFELIFYSQAFLVKIIPCCLLVAFISLLINQLIIIKKNNKKLSAYKQKVNNFIKV